MGNPYVDPLTIIIFCMHVLANLQRLTLALLDNSGWWVEEGTLKVAWNSVLAESGERFVMTPGTPERLKWSAVSLASMPPELRN